MTSIVWPREIADLQIEVNLLREKLFKAQRAHVISIAEFKVGDMIEWGYGSMRYQGKVTGHGWNAYDALTYRVQHHKKDGTLGNQKVVYAVFDRVTAC